MTTVREVIEAVDQLRRELNDLIAKSPSETEEAVVSARFDRWSNRAHTKLTGFGFGEDANTFSGAHYQTVSGDWRGNLVRHAKAKDAILWALRDDMESHPHHYEPKLVQNTSPIVASPIEPSKVEFLPMRKPPDKKLWKRADVIALASCIVTLIVGIPSWFVLRHPDKPPVVPPNFYSSAVSFDDPVKQACMNGSIVDCQNYAGRIRVKCNPYDAACKLLAMCWDDKVRALKIVDNACNHNPNSESCEFQRKNMRANLEMDCDKKTLANF